MRIWDCGSAAQLTRILTLPLMIAFELSLIWRQIGPVSEAVRELNRRGLLWSGPTKVSQQAVSQRLGSFPAELFHRVLIDLLPQLPRQIWYEEDSQTHDQTIWEQAVASLPKGVLLLFDLGFTN